MRIGIITFHRAINYGAVLQTYALQKFLNDSNYDAEVLLSINGINECFTS